MTQLFCFSLLGCSPPPSSLFKLQEQTWLCYRTSTSHISRWPQDAFHGHKLTTLQAHATPPDSRFQVCTLSVVCMHFWQCLHVVRPTPSRLQQPPWQVPLTSATNLFPDEHTPLRLLQRPHDAID